MAHSYIQGPPDSSGKKVHTNMVVDGNSEEIHTQVVVLADKEFPEQQQSIDNQGQAYIRFAEGSPAFSAFGASINTEPTLMAMYKFYEADQASHFEKKAVGTADVAFDAAFGGIKLSTGTADGDSVTYTSHKYHHYRPGNGMPITFTMKAGDTGKTNLERRVGLFDDNDGVFLEMIGTSVAAVIRSSLTGTENTTDRSNWTGDRLDGAGGHHNLSGVTLDPTKNSIWWIDYQYLGAGAVRFGTFVDGNKVICHTVGHYNALDRQWAATPSLPFRMEQKNNGITASSSEWHVFCAVVQSEGYSGQSLQPVTVNNTKTMTSTTDFIPILSFQPSQININGFENRIRALIRSYSIISTQEPIEVMLSAGPDFLLTGATFSERLGNIDYDIDATAIIAVGVLLGVGYCAGGNNSILDVSNLFDINTDGLYRNADITGSNVITLSIKLMTGTTTKVGMAVSVLEIS